MPGMHTRARRWGLVMILLIATTAGAVRAALVTGFATEVGSNIVHPNGNVYDQVLLTGAAATVQADRNQVTRVSSSI